MKLSDKEYVRFKTLKRLFMSYEIGFGSPEVKELIRLERRILVSNNRNI